MLTAALSAKPGIQGSRRIHHGMGPEVHIRQKGLGRSQFPLENRVYGCRASQASQTPNVTWEMNVVVRQTVAVKKTKRRGRIPVWAVRWSRNIHLVHLCADSYH